MSCLHRNICFASHGAILFLALAGCDPWTPPETENGAVPSESACTNWKSYDEDWHRRHCNVAIRWCDMSTTPRGWTPVGSSSGTAGATGTNGAGGTTGSPTGAVGGAGGGGAGDAGLTGGGGSASVDSGVAVDGGHVVTDAGHAAGDGTTACIVSATCPLGTSCVTGSCQPCAAGVCACQRDDDCSASQVCNHDVGACATPPPTCAALTTEAACSARADCAPIYGGMSCTNTVGSPCHSGEANCTCATYDFAACVARD